MSAPRWTAALLRRLAPADHVDDVLGDLDEAHGRRVFRRGRVVANILTALDALDMAWALVRGRHTTHHAQGSAIGMIPDRRQPPMISGLDFKLGLRMLRRYPGLTLVGGIAMAFAIALGAGYYEFVTQVVNPRLPLADGHDVVGIRLWHAPSGRVEGRSARDFVLWREALQSVDDLGAFRTGERNLIREGRDTQPVLVAEISASAFRLTRIPALLGRSLVAADEQVGAAPVVVLGYDVWQAAFGGTPDVVGQTVRLGSTPSTIVGIMPEGYAFPISHDVWVPLQLAVSADPAWTGPTLQTFGRLAPGRTIGDAQAEVATIGLRMAADFPETHEALRPQVLPFAQSVTDFSFVESVLFRLFNLFFVVLLVVVCSNVALLMFARATARETELVVRTALGASRARIIGQLSAEALVLGGVATAAGLGTAGFFLRWWLGVFTIESDGRLPFWFDASLAPETIFYAGLLTLLGAAITGVVPALKVTGRKVDLRLRQGTAGGGGLQFGGVWTAVIVVQVALTVALPATAYVARRHVVAVQTYDVGFARSEYLSARLGMDEAVSTDRSIAPGERPGARAGRVYRELADRLAAEPGVAGVTFTTRLPGTYHSQRWIELDDGDASPRESAEGYRIGTAAVPPDYFEVLDAPVVAGRAFHSGDIDSAAGVVIVNQSFVQRIMEDRSPIGRRLRYTVPPDVDPGPWYEVVGVVKDLGMTNGSSAADAGLYHPVGPGDAAPTYLALRTTEDPGTFVPRLRTVAADVDPMVRLHDPQPLDEAAATMWLEMDFLSRLLALASALAIILSLAGIYSVMAFTISRRTREVGIRVAMGASPGRVILAIFRRPLAQLGLGILLGTGLTSLVVQGAPDGGLSVTGTALVAAYATVMLAVCLLACIAPTRRALTIEPTEALRVDG